MVRHLLRKLMVAVGKFLQGIERNNKLLQLPHWLRLQVQNVLIVAGWDSYVRHGRTLPPVGRTWQFGLGRAGRFWHVCFRAILHTERELRDVESE